MLGARSLLGSLLALLLLGGGAIGLPASAVTAASTAGTTEQVSSKPKPDPRWVFYTKDKRRYTSPWFGGARRIMIPFGCTRAPYYSPDPRCKKDRGFHHGLDLAMPCGTRLWSDRYAWVVSGESLGPAYGETPLLLRNHKVGFDLVIGHVRKVYVDVGDRVRPGDLIARASDDGAPDGCHLHFERRAKNGGLDTAVRPREMLDLTAKRKQQQ
ncbi:M23 family metallopeptidase [Nocardioides ferulae]|uniref:M23 family metallopeptidase n=1 Tax=Nocardioides ferulae TaxID=2340821 RepID=UPI000EB53D1F|nr:M23 family metallopeptidase [Nocardioides ferulae]